MALIQSTAIPGGAADAYEIDYSYLNEHTGSGTNMIGLGSNYGSGYSSTIDNRRKRTIAYWLKMNKVGGQTHEWQLVHFTGSVSENLAIQTDHEDGDAYVNTINWGASIIRCQQLDNASWFHFMVQIDTTNTNYGTSDPSTSPDARGRVKVYINGVHKQWDNQLDNHTGLPGYNHYPGGNDNSDTGDGQDILIGKGGVRRSAWIADLHYLDNTIAAPTDFGKFNDDGIWIPIETSFTTAQYGSAGAHLEFKQSGTSSNGQSSTGLGADTSGNNNHAYIYQNSLDLTSNPQKTDTPTNNFCTLNSMDMTTNTTYKPTIRKGSLEYQPESGSSTIRGTQAVTQGKWYWECRLITTAGQNFGVCTANLNIPVASSQENGSIINADHGDAEFFSVYAASHYRSYHFYDGTNWNSAAAWSDVTNFSAGDVFGFAWDLDNLDIYMSKNGSWTGVLTNQDPEGDPGSNTPFVYHAAINRDEDTHWLPIFSNTYNQDMEINFGNPGFAIASANQDANGYGKFEYPVPDGYYALCSKNLAEFDPPDVDDPSKHFQVDTFKATSGGGDAAVFDGNSALQPDMIIVKSKTTAYWWQVHDSSRGPTAGAIYPNTNGAESSSEIDSFDSDGWQGDAGNDAIHDTDDTILTYGWKANGGSKTSVSQSGSGATQVLASTYQADTTGGFSICTWTGTGGAGKITHGLGAVPAVIWVKRLDTTYNWFTYHRSTGPLKSSLTGTAAHNHYMNLDTHYGLEENSTVWNDTAPDANYFTVGTASATNTGTYVAYAWAEKKGYSKFSHYVGNGMEDGPFIYTGFLPAMIIVKGADNDNHWFTFDNQTAIAQSSYTNRSNEGVRNYYMSLADHSTPATQNSTHGMLIVAFVSNGFKILKGSSYFNQSGKNYIYYAFAEAPLVSSGGTPTTGNAQERYASAGGNTFTGTL